MRYVLALIIGIAISFSVHADTLSIASDGFNNGGIIPELFTCDGKNISPEIHWSVLPKNTKALALILSDEDAPNGIFYHWILYNIPTNVQNLSQGTALLPTGTMVGKNSWGKTQYNGPCPPKGSKHHYTFSLYALDQVLNLPEGSDATDLLEVMKNYIIQQATLKGLYNR